MTIELWKSKLHNAQVLNLVFAALATVLAVALVANGFFGRTSRFMWLPISPLQGILGRRNGRRRYYKGPLPCHVALDCQCPPPLLIFHHRQLLQWVPIKPLGLCPDLSGAEPCT